MEPSLILERIDSLFQVAHRDFEFASIYSTRKTNTILLKGFSNLSEALHKIAVDLDHVGQQLQSGFRSLEVAIDSMEDAFSKGVREMGSSMEKNSERIALLNHESVETEKRMLDTLDNIQQGRVPLPTFSSEWKNWTQTTPKGR